MPDSTNTSVLPVSHEAPVPALPSRTRVSRRSARVASILAALFLAVAIVRIVATYDVFSHTFDEPAHIATGLEWLSRGSYTFEFHTPPLARIAVALGPWLAGAESLGERSMWIEAREVMNTGAGYYRNLELARIGVLPFLMLACAMVWRYARRLGDSTVAVGAVAAFTALPPVLANASVATTDIPFTATFLSLLIAFSWWLERPGSRTRGAVVGLAGAFALCTKFSTLPFFGLAVILMLGIRAIDARRAIGRTEGVAAATVMLPLSRQALEASIIALIVAAAICTVVYRFSFGLVGGVLLPAPELFWGIAQVAEHNAQGHATYLLGKAATESRWDFFPVAIAVKTPLAFLALVIIGAVQLVRRWWNSGDTRLLDPLLVSLGVLGVAMASNINLGVRHLLPVYALLAVAAGYGAVSLWRSRRRVSRLTAVALTAWLAVASARAHPDYIASFNEIAGDEPGKILVDSDLDWGQDAERLAAEVRRRGIVSLSLAYFGSGDHVFRIVPGARPLPPNEPVGGWVAVSETNYRRGRVSLDNGVWRVYPDAYLWLHEHQPVAMIGKTIRLYHIEATAR